MVFFKIIAGIFLVILLGGFSWALTHWRKIKREMISHEALPKSAPRSFLLVIAMTIMIVLSSLLTYEIIFA